MATVREALTDVIVKQLGVTADQVTPRAHIKSALGADSLDAVELIMAIEDRFGFKIDDIRAEAIVTVEDALLCLSDAGFKPDDQAP